MMRSLFMATLFALTAGATPALSSETVTTPYELVRTLQRVQDRIALGSVRAHNAQRRLLQHIGVRFAAIDSAAWREPRNTHALVTYLLSGGDPKVGRKIYAGGIADERERDLIKAALAYAEGRRSAALKLLNDVDPRTLPAPLGGHVALIKSALYQKSEPKKSMANLDLARLLMPGTLIEESALRRGVVAAGNDGNLDRFQYLSSQYLNRFGASAYGADFDAKFSMYLVKLSYLNLPARQERFEQMVASLNPVRIRKLYLSLARNAITGGQIGFASFAAGKAVQLSPPQSAELERAHAYQAVAMVTEDPGEALNKLNRLDLERLSKSDREIISAAMTLSHNLMRKPAPEMPAADPSPHSAAMAKPIEMPAGSTADGVAARAEKLIETVDHMLLGKM